MWYRPRLASSGEEQMLCKNGFEGTRLRFSGQKFFAHGKEFVFMQNFDSSKYSLFDMQQLNETSHSKTSSECKG